MSRCRSCHAKIVWALTETGQSMPVDAFPHPDGTLVFTENPDGGGGAPVAVVDLEYRGDKYLAHFAVCPQADQWRRS